MGRGLKLTDLAFLGRVGNSVTPNSLSGLAAWWKADSYSLADNTTIGGSGKEWIDQTGGGNNGTTGFGAVKYRTAGIAGTHPSVEIGGTYLSISNISLTGDFTIIVVAETNGDTAWLGNTGANVQIRRRRSGVNNMSFYPGSGSEVISDGFASADAALVSLCWRRSGTTISLRENKTARTGGTNGGSFTLNEIGGSQFVGGSGDVGEILVCSQFNSDALVDSLYDAYLKVRWPLP